MDVKEVMKNVLQTTAAAEIINEIMWFTLKGSLETCVEMRQELDIIVSMGEATEVEMEDWERLAQDIAALERVIDYYGG